MAVLFSIDLNRRIKELQTSFRFVFSTFPSPKFPAKRPNLKPSKAEMMNADGAKEGIQEYYKNIT